MGTKINWKKDLWESIEEKDVIQLRNRIYKMHCLNAKIHTNYAMKSGEDKDIKS